LWRLVSKTSIDRVQLISLATRAVILTLALGSCNESLPPYAAPAGVFEGQLQGSYVLSMKENSFKVYFTIKNVFDETIQGPEELTGSILIVSARSPDIKKTFLLTGANIIEASGSNRAGGTLLIDPGGSIRFGVSWNFVDDEDRDLREGFFRFTEDPSCHTRRRSSREDFVLTAVITLYDRTAPIFVGPVVYPLCYFTELGILCPPVLSDAPCQGSP
jgi:hypothetical protein